MPGVAGDVSGGANADACQAADVVIVAVPWDGHAETVASLRNSLIGKIVVDCVNPLGFDAKGPFALRVPEGSAAEQTESLLPESRVCAAFHHVSAVLLADPTVDRIDLDVLVLGDDRDAVAIVIALAARIDGMRGVYAGRLRNAAQVEALTANIIAINRRYKAHAGSAHHRRVAPGRSRDQKPCSGPGKVPVAHLVGVRARRVGERVGQVARTA